ncbi:MAG: hypothetical protein IJ299_06075, partial [Oscillospiraceae bacterium]|nr:hypothetical protein [Oscillospiraceae bacterium]
LISDTAGVPEKRLGWRTVENFGAHINGIFSFGNEDNQCMIIHAGTSLYKLNNGEITELISGIANLPSQGRYFKGKLCILTGEEYLVFDGETCVRAGEFEDMYAPTTLMSREPLPLSGANPFFCDVYEAWEDNGVFQNASGNALNPGTVPENVAINLVSGKRKNTFCMSSSGLKLFVLDSIIDKKSRVTMKCITTGQTIFSVVYDPESGYVRYGESDGKVAGINTGFVNLFSIGSGSQYTLQINQVEDRNATCIMCSINTGKLNGYRYISGVDNFSIEFTHEVEGYADRIGKCTVMDVFENRLFFSGNPDYPNVDWYSGVNDPLYVPDINYTEIGMDSSRIMGYLRTGSEQAILKSDGDDATIYMRSYSTLSDGTVIFPVKHGTSGLGAIAERAICTFLDDPLYLTRNGVYAIGMQDISNERALNIRSTRVNKRLLGEKGLKDALMCEWRGYLVLCVDGKAYVADAAQKQYPRNVTNTFEYEWYYWTNIPATALYESGGELFFGTEDGRLCKFNTDLSTESGEVYSDDGKAIEAEWATGLSNDGNFMQEKTLVKTGSGVMLKAYNSTGISVIVRTDHGNEQEIVTRSKVLPENEAMSDFVIPFNSRIKKYGAIQIICRNNIPDSAFGIVGIIRRYFYGKIKK